jgi:hypothetical protein
MTNYVLDILAPIAAKILLSAFSADKKIATESGK